MPVKASRLLRPAIGALTALAPAVMLLLLLRLGFGALPGDYTPWGSDQLDYWHETQSMRKAGFAPGYYGYEEHPARLGRYGGHGFMFPLFYATLSRLTGWDYATPVYFNTALLVAAWAVFLCMTRPGLGRSLFCLALSLTFTPLFYWQGVLMQEPVQFAAAIVLAGWCALLLERKRENRLTTAFSLGFFTFLFLVGLLRFTWAFLCVPLFFCTRTDRAVIKPLLQAGVFIGLELVLYVAFVAPYPYVTSVGTMLRQAIGGNAAPLLAHFRYNATEVFANQAFFYFNLVSYEIFFFLLVSGVVLLRSRKRDDASQAARAFPWEALAPSFLIVFILAFFFVVHIVNGIIIGKHVAPFLLFGILLLSGRIPLKYSWLFVVINLLLFPAFLADYRSAHYTSYVRSALLRQYIGEFKAKIAPYVRYEPKASPWCNTMVMTNFPGVISGLPAGVAFNNVYASDKLQGPLKSQYVLVASQGQRDQFARFNDLEFLTATQYGDLYRNKSSLCFAAPAKPGNGE